MAANAADASGPQLVPFDAQPQYPFGPWPIAASEVFARTRQSYAFVNLKPLVPGHVLVSPLRPAPRFADLAPAEVADMMCLAQRVAAALERHYGATAVTLAVQDGAAAGQTVPHVHVHVLPRRPGDFPKNDQVYDDLEAQERGMARDLERHTAPAQKLDLDIDRKPRTREEMSAEAATLRALFPVVE